MTLWAAFIETQRDNRLQEVPLFVGLGRVHVPSFALLVSNADQSPHQNTSFAIEPDSVETADQIHVYKALKKFL
jgi:hypothetical protein